MTWENFISPLTESRWISISISLTGIYIYIYRYIHIYAPIVSIGHFSYALCLINQEAIIHLSSLPGCPGPKHCWAVSISHCPWRIEAHTTLMLMGRLRWHLGWLRRPTTGAGPPSPPGAERAARASSSSGGTPPRRSSSPTSATGSCTHSPRQDVGIVGNLGGPVFSNRTNAAR